MSLRVLTGITTSGTPHLGNYVGAIRPAIVASQSPDSDCFFFMADYHALIKCDDPARIERSRLEIAATWLAAGLDPERVTFYRQSDVPEVTELNWLLTCVTAKGQMNRAHAYKASTDVNEAAGEDPDAGITMGLFCYPILMAADILLFNPHKVPVGRDQIQHIEMTRDVAARFNHLFGQGSDLFVLPEAHIEEHVATLPGLDGRKMSKSYDNTIPLFEGGQKAMKEAIAKIVTNSLLPGDAKDPDNSHLVTIFEAFASKEQTQQFKDELRAGLGWGDAKKRLLDLIERDIAPMRERYEALMAHPEEIEVLLQAGAAKARAAAAPLLKKVRESLGLRTMQAIAAPLAKAEKKAALPLFKQFRLEDGLFYFNFSAADGRLLLQSTGFAQGKEAGQWIAKLKNEGVAAIEGTAISLSEGVTATDVSTALAVLLAE
ncbi:tryptophan--tRNA ligase [Janthinobacterium sp. B9-8]|uniref:tryptophan--tRNA ligase n=1 Tax=Janthinobacterium sp. B9-8 TaxID=1236179 RepID=UPI00061D0967|nr:tryptophan--tRNA ligase [Janthinobacterium sp. B9-8]AMC34493.1 tryptophan--tRNA ligase [Janthinobacterium sp. B9-8]